MKKTMASLFLAACFPLTVFAVSAENECHTNGTSFSGDPRNCGGEVCVAAYRLQASSATVTKTNGFGAVSECYAPRIVNTEEEDEGRTTRVTRMCASFHARSPSGMTHINERGTVRCELSVKSWDN